MVIAYSLIGIPLMLMFLANIGEFMARAFRLGYTRGCCFICWRRRKKNYDADVERRNNMKASKAAEADIESAHGSDGQPEKDIQGQNGKTEPGEKWANGFMHDKSLERPESASSKSESEPSEQDFPDELPDDEFLNVPISLTVVVTFMYLLIGAILFATWNGWTWIQGAYFSFITLATIGFGDFIPGWHEADTLIGRIKLVISCLYIVFGLAVLSMGFNLMVDEMISKFKWLGRQIGIIKRPIGHGVEGHEDGHTPSAEKSPPETQPDVVVQEVEDGPEEKPTVT